MTKSQIIFNQELRNPFDPMIPRRTFLLHFVIPVLLFLSAPNGYSAGFQWGKFARQPNAFFQSEEAKETAANILTWQTRYGDWPKNIDTAAKRTAEDGDPGGTFDNGATLGEIRFLARMFRITGEARYKGAALKGLDHVLASQYENGGFPQRNPTRPDSYERYITFNDNAMVNILEFLRECETSPDFSFLDPARREKIKTAFAKGIDCILACQVESGGRLTVWCAQHDERTLAPAKARSYELPSLSGGESGDILRFLMSLDDPSPEVVWAIDAGCRWYEDSKITGLRQIIVEGDKIMVADPDAPPLWARFYELETNRSFFCGRDGIVKYDISEIEPERRKGYSWYTETGKKVAAQWEIWKKRFPDR